MTSCNIFSTKDNFSDVDFSSEVEINFEYNFENFDATVTFNNSTLYFKYLDNCGTMSGTEVWINTNEYTISNDGLEFNGNTDELSDNFLPLVMYELLSENNGLIKIQMYDEIKKCSYFEDSISTSFVRFEIYENNNKKAYSIIIT